VLGKRTAQNNDGQRTDRTKHIYILYEDKREKERGANFGSLQGRTMSSQAMGDGQIRLVRSLIVIGSVLRIVKREERRERDNNKKEKKEERETQEQSD
jgi:hypothetical protein